MSDAARPSDASMEMGGIMSSMPLKPRSLVLDMFGEYLRYVGGEVRLGHLTTLLESFDIAPATVRVTMSRLRREGWFTTHRAGRETVYKLTDTILGVLDDGRERIFATAPESWSGTWTMVIYQLSESERQERTQLRKSLQWHGFGPLTTSTWLAPGDRRGEVAGFVGDSMHEQVDVLLCSGNDLEQDRALARRCWDLDRLAVDYEDFVDAHAHLATLPVALSGPEALITRTELISTFRHFPFRDPRLPPELRPPDWPGAEAHQLFKSVYSSLGPAARGWVGTVIGHEVPVPDAPFAPSH